MGRLASLPMYDWPEVSDAWDRLWIAIRGGLKDRNIDAPAQLERPRDLMAHWLAPDLVLSQTCGWPLVNGLARRVAVLGAFDFGADIGPPGFYQSLAVVRAGQNAPLAGLCDKGILACNDRGSLSGYRVLKIAGVALRAVKVTGSHRASIRAVAAGEADFAMIDAVTWRLARAYEGGADTLAIIGRSGHYPGLPLITRVGEDPSAYRSAIASALTRETRAAKTLGIRGFVPFDFDDYARALR